MLLWPTTERWWQWKAHKKRAKMINKNNQKCCSLATMTMTTDDEKYKNCFRNFILRRSLFTVHRAELSGMNLTEKFFSLCCWASRVCMWSHQQPIKSAMNHKSNLFFIYRSGVADFSAFSLCSFLSVHKFVVPVFSQWKITKFAASLNLTSNESWKSFFSRIFYSLFWFSRSRTISNLQSAPITYPH